ncbi:alpha/beta hydrolase [Archangium lansingense]|uniref:alpha/beta hydrolase n=1 Tax=Archangium lansingense TaxID=2995310 RepID=UPI003B809807
MKHLLLSALVLLTPRLSPASEAAPAPAPTVTGAVTREVRATNGERIPLLVLEPHRPAKGPAPVAVLVHGLTRSKEDWLVDAKPTFGGAFTEALRGAGYRVYLFDARLHGARAVEGDKPSARVKRSHEGDSGPYRSMVAGTIEDAHAVLAHALEGARPPRVLLGGYSMGAQVALLLAAREPRVTHLVTMVPPYVDPTLAEVAPVLAAGRIQQRWLLLTARRDGFATPEQNEALFTAAPSRHKVHHTFDSGHALPRDYLSEVQRWLAAEP